MIIQNFENNYLLGCIKYQDKYVLYLMPIAWWILNYEKYDPNYNPNEWQYIFRDNIMNVADNQIDNFIKSINNDKIEDIDGFKYAIKNLPLEYRRVCFYIDFDKKEFINGFYDIEVEDYLPDENWIGKFGNPIESLPIEIKALFPKSWQ